MGGEGGAIEGDLWTCGGGSYRGGPVEGGAIEGDLWGGAIEGDLWRGEL